MNPTITIRGKTYAEVFDAKIFLDGNIQQAEEIKRAIIQPVHLEKLLERFGNASLSINKSSQTKNIKIYDKFNDKYYFGGIAGVANIENFEIALSEDEEPITIDVVLNVTTKFDKNDNGQPYFLATMLLQDKLDLGKNTVPSDEEEIYDFLLLFWFKEQLENAMLRGFFKTYRRFEKNDSRLKGTIDIARHIRENIGRDNGKIAYNYRESTINNYMNALIVAAYDHLKQKYYKLVTDNIDSDHDILGAISYLRQETKYSKEMLSGVLKEASRKPISHPFFIEYEELRTTCLRILRDEGVSIFEGADQDVKGVLFYVPDLWENYVERKLITYFKQFSVISQNTLRVLSKPTDKNGFFIETRPDYVFFKDNTPVMVLDSKFRPDWENAVFGTKLDDISKKDYDKCLRDMVDFGCHITGTLFPFGGDTVEIPNNNNTYIHTISKHNCHDLFLTIPFVIPEIEKDTKFDTWAEKLEENSKNAVGILSKIDPEKAYAMHKAVNRLMSEYDITKIN